MAATGAALEGDLLGVHASQAMLRLPGGSVRWVRMRPGAKIEFLERRVEKAVTSKPSVLPEGRFGSVHDHSGARLVLKSRRPDDWEVGRGFVIWRDRFRLGYFKVTGIDARNSTVSGTFTVDVAMPKDYEVVARVRGESVRKRQPKPERREKTRKDAEGKRAREASSLSQPGAKQD